MTDNSVKSFGRYLKSVRLEKGISLDEIAAATRISGETLLSIEDEDHEKLPAAVFIKGFIRSYAKKVGADGELAVHRFEASLATFEATALQQSERMRSQQVFWPRLAIGLFLLAAIVLGSIYALSIGKIDSQEQPPETSPGASLQAPPAAPPSAPHAAPLPESTPAEKSDVDIAPTPPAAVPSPPAEMPSPAPEIPSPVSVPLSPAAAPEPPLAGAPPDETPPSVVPDDMKQRLLIDTVEETWLKVIIDGMRTREYMLKPGDRLQLEAQKGFNLLIGNAAGIAMQLNGKTVPVDGKSGQVITLQVP